MASKGTNKAVVKNPAKKKKKIPAARAGDVTNGQLSSAVAQANKIGQLLDKRFSFDIDRKTNKVIVRVVDKNTGNVIRVIPPGEMLRMAAHLKQLRVLNDKVIGAAELVILDHKG